MFARTLEKKNCVKDRKIAFRVIFQFIETLVKHIPMKLPKKWIENGQANHLNG